MRPLRIAPLGLLAALSLGCELIVGDASRVYDADADTAPANHDGGTHDSAADVYTGCGATCVSQDNSCIASCAQAEELCVGNCANNGNCPQQCQTAQMQCDMHCMMTCMMCLPQCTGPNPCPNGS